MAAGPDEVRGSDPNQNIEHFTLSLNSSLQYVSRPVVAIGAAFGEDTPDDPCHLVGERHGSDTERSVAEQPHDPRRAFGGSAQRKIARAQRTSYVLIAYL
ncbi:hypothetical protein X772_33635 [Mesorhizobium sp. LSJC280B00]|nr:hypothetical protein X772_33635 [Mesorhizobium sp. LSJC280B00]